MGFSRLDTLPFFHANGFHREVSVKQVERLRKNSPHYVSWFDLVDDSYNPGQNDVTTVSNEVGSLATLTVSPPSPWGDLYSKLPSTSRIPVEPILSMIFTCPLSRLLVFIVIIIASLLRLYSFSIYANKLFLCRTRIVPKAKRVYRYLRPSWP